MTYLSNKDSRVSAAVERIRALRAYTQASGFRTTKAQNDLLASLDSEVLTAVLYEMRHELIERITRNASQQPAAAF